MVALAEDMNKAREATAKKTYRWCRPPLTSFAAVTVLFGMDKTPLKN
jgi:hypothetical protein